MDHSVARQFSDYLDLDDYMLKFNCSIFYTWLKLPSSAPTQLNFNFNWGWDSLIFSLCNHPPGYPPTHLTTDKVVKWNKTSSTLIEDFKYLNLSLQIFQLKTSNTSKSTQTKLVIMTTVTKTFVPLTFLSVTIVLYILGSVHSVRIT